MAFLHGRLITIEEVAARLCADGRIIFRSTTDALEWIRARTRRKCPVEERIPCIPVPGGGILFDDDEVNAWIENRNRPLPPGASPQERDSESVEAARLLAIDEAGAMLRAARDEGIAAGLTEEEL